MLPLSVNRFCTNPVFVLKWVEDLFDGMGSHEATNIAVFSAKVPLWKVTLRIGTTVHAIATASAEGD